jgi:hypothetical protein
LKKFIFIARFFLLVPHKSMSEETLTEKIAIEPGQTRKL